MPAQDLVGQRARMRLYAHTSLAHNSPSRLSTLSSIPISAARILQPLHLANVSSFQVRSRLNTPKAKRNRDEANVTDGRATVRALRNLARPRTRLTRPRQDRRRVRPRRKSGRGRRGVSGRSRIIAASRGREGIRTSRRTVGGGLRKKGGRRRERHRRTLYRWWTRAWRQPPHSDCIEISSVSARPAVRNCEEERGIIDSLERRVRRNEQRKESKGECVVRCECERGTSEERRQRSSGGSNWGCRRAVFGRRKDGRGQRRRLCGRRSWSAGRSGRASRSRLLAMPQRLQLLQEGVEVDCATS